MYSYVIMSYKLLYKTSGTDSFMFQELTLMERLKGIKAAIAERKNKLLSYLLSQCLPDTVIIWLPVLNSKMNEPLHSFIRLSLTSCFFHPLALEIERIQINFHLAGLRSPWTQHPFGNFSPVYSRVKLSKRTQSASNSESSGVHCVTTTHRTYVSFFKTAIGFLCQHLHRHRNTDLTVWDALLSSICDDATVQYTLFPPVLGGLFFLLYLKPFKR